MTQEVSFYRDSLKSYMVIRCPEGTMGEGYQYRMLAANHIDGLLDCSFRTIDADSYLYYDITSRQKLSSIFLTRRMSADDVRRVLRDTASVRQNLADFLLDSSRMLMNPDFIFCDLSGGACAFTYFPESAEESGIQPLLEFMESHVDERDSEASSILYRLLSMSGSENFFPDRDILDRVLGTDIESKEESRQEADRIYGCYDQPIPEQTAEDMGIASFTEDGNKEVEEIPDRRHLNKKILTRAAGVLCIAAGIVLYGVWDLYSEWIVSESVVTLCRAGMFLLPAAGAVILAACKFSKKKGSASAPKSAPKREKQKTDDSAQQAFIYPPEYPDSFQIRDGQNKQNGQNRNKVKADVYDADFGRTVVLNQTDSARGRLYGTGKAQGIQISLEELPCTIGKMREYAGIVLNDSSVSRIHAAVNAGEDGQIYIRDLNSTNGTAVNGVGLRPDKGVSIRPGDVIRIGALSFVYRQG